MSVSPLRLSPQSSPRNSPPTPTRSSTPTSVQFIKRMGSPALSLPYWEVTGESGCVPSPTKVALGRDHQEWWGGKFFFPLSEFDLLVANLPKVLANGELDERINHLPLLDLHASPAQKNKLDKQAIASTKYKRPHAEICPSSKLVSIVLDTELERENAFALFAFLANAYVFSRQSTVQPIVLPAQIAQPLLRLAAELDRQPITDYACSVLNNWTLLDAAKGVNLENLKIQRTFTGTEAEKWFFAIHCVIECEGGKAFSSMNHSRDVIDRFMMFRKLQGDRRGSSEMHAVAIQRALQHSNQFSIRTQRLPASVAATPMLSPQITDRNTFYDACFEACRKVTLDLIVLQQAIVAMKDTITRLPEYCPPDVFFDRIRPWVSSWPECGVIYSEYCIEESNLKPPAMHFSGASGAQSSLLPCIDAFMGISYHSSDQARTDLGAFIRQLKKFRSHMPPMHRDLVERYESPAAGNVRDLIGALDEYALGGLEDATENAKLADMVDELKLAYNHTIDSLVVFRRKHTEYATMYIKTMAAKRNARANKQQGAASSPLVVPQPTVAVTSGKGTGGSDYSIHLARHVNDTKKALYDIRKKE